MKRKHMWRKDITLQAHNTCMYRYIHIGYTWKIPRGDALNSQKFSFYIFTKNSRLKSGYAEKISVYNPN